MPKVITVTSILKTKARASCHRAVYRPSPAGRSAKLFPALVSEVFVGCRMHESEIITLEGEENGERGGKYVRIYFFIYMHFKIGKFLMFKYDVTSL